MNILFITHALNLSGVAIYTRNLGTGLQVNGHRLFVAARGMDEGKPFGREWYEAMGFTVLQISFPGYGLNPANLIGAARSILLLYRTIIQQQIDIIHVQAPTLAPYAYAATRMARRGRVVTVFNIEQIGSTKRRLARMANAVIPSALGDAAIAISSEMQEKLVGELHFHENHVHLICYGVDANEFAPPTAKQRVCARLQFGLTPADFVISMLAILDPRKNHALLFRAAKLLVSQGISLKVLCAGGEYEHYGDTLRRQIHDIGIESFCRFLGHVPARELLWASDISVLPSFEEGFGLVVAEAMLCGVVPIRTPAAGAKDQVIDGNTGYIVDFDDESQLAERIKYLYENPTMRRQMAKAAVIHAKSHLSKAVMTEKTLALYEDLLAQR